MWVIIGIILLGILPVFPSSSTESVRLDLPTYDANGGFARQKIEVFNACEHLSFFSLNELDKIPLSIPDKSYSSDVKNPEVVSHEFKNLKISIFSIKACDKCIDDASLRLLEDETCLMNQSSVFGYFEKCTEKYVCERTPFMLSDNVEMVSPNGEFKVEMKPYVIKTKIKDDRTINVIDKYYVELIITYPDWKPLPYMKWIGSALLFVLDPLKSILRYFTERWFY